VTRAVLEADKAYNVGLKRSFSQVTNPGKLVNELFEGETISLGMFVVNWARCWKIWFSIRPLSDILAAAGRSALSSAKRSFAHNARNTRILFLAKHSSYT
jgi:hypothetical protein